MPYECVAFLNWIRFCNGNANNKAIFVVVIGVSHNIHMIGHCNSKRKEREKNEPKTSQIKRMYCGQWIEVDYHWYGYGYGLWTIDSGWPNGTFLSSLYCVNAFMLLTLFQFSLWCTCQDSFTSLNSMRYSNRLTAPVSLHWTLGWILRYWTFSMVIRIKLYK